jgi:hypothetical protein
MSAKARAAIKRKARFQEQCGEDAVDTSNEAVFETLDASDFSAKRVKIGEPENFEVVLQAAAAVDAIKLTEERVTKVRSRNVWARPG